MVNSTADFLIIGGGVVGLCLALEARRHHPQAKIVILEKEREVAAHASGRNSGVLHAGFYYTADSLKAKFTLQGNQRWKAYCREKNIRVNECGKLVVAKDESELAGLEMLYQRGLQNGVPVELISLADAKKIEPRVKSFEKALWSPETASVNPKEILARLTEDLKAQRVEFQFSNAYLANQRNEIQTTQQKISAGYVINAAGLYADKIARNFGFSQNYQIVPFKGLYLYSEEPAGAVKTNIYPVPDLKYPFLGVHFTITAEGKIKIGPTAIPALWRENYSGFKNFKWKEFCEIFKIETGLFFRNEFQFRRLAWMEIKKNFKSKMVNLASVLLEGVHKKDYRHWGAPGIRAQLFDLKQRKLEMDFKFEGDEKSFHVLNAVSPAFTCAMPFAEFLWGEIGRVYVR